MREHLRPIAADPDAQQHFLPQADLAVRDAISSLHITTPPPTAFNGSEIKFDVNGQNTLAPPFIVQWQNGLPILVTPAEVAVAPLKWPS